MTELRTPNINLVPFVSVDNMMKFVSSVGIETLLKELTEHIENDFKRWALFDKAPRVASHSKVGVIELMPTSDGEVYGFKYVNGHPENIHSNLQTVTGFGVLARVDTGYPVLFSEMTILTALRTAATSAMAAKYLAPTDADCMAIIGNGAQSEFQALAFQSVLGINKLRLFDIDSAATKKCAYNLRNKGFEIESCASAEAAVEGAQIVTTVTADKQYATILTPNMVGAGVHINAIGGDCPGKTELHKDILLSSDIFTEFTPQTRIEGELQQLPETHEVTELWEVISGNKLGRTAPLQTTLFDSVGFAVEDFAALSYVRAKLETHPHFEALDMLADPDDPRDLFGMLVRSETAA